MVSKYWFGSCGRDDQAFISQLLAMTQDGLWLLPMNGLQSSLLLS